MAVCLIGLGSNLGDRRQMLGRAVEQLAGHAAVRLCGQSPWLETSPAGGPSHQPPFLNGAVVVETSLPPEAMLEFLHEIEAGLGRRRQERWGPRPIDLDLLLCDREVRQTPALVLPHPRMTWRRFVLEPAASVAAAMVHPLTGWTVQQHLDHLNSSAFYVAITGPATSHRTELARQVALRSGAHAIIAAPAGNGRPLGLEFLRQWSALLSPDWPGWSAAAGVVSDFWFDEAIVRLPPERRQEHLALWESLRAAAVRPRLIVLLEAIAEGPEGQFGQDLLALATRPGQGPLLRLSGDDPAAAVPEVLAAMEAMK
jgi:2-amino-4-hydroxy-6-hydroxymethyldihydropteridine diphosphokinase